MVAVTPIILAGGSGTRLAPYSTEDKPKPYVELGGITLLRRTMDRYATLGTPYVVGRAKDERHLADYPQMSWYPEEHQDGTFYAVHKVVTEIHSYAPDTICLVTPCDHWIEDRHALFAAITQAWSLMPRGVVAFGTTPVRVEPGYGHFYPAPDNMIMLYKEKPDDPSAFMKNGALWNTGLFMFHAEWFMEVSLQACFGRDDNFERAVMENKELTRMYVELDCGWRDIGTKEAFDAIHAERA